tara:strand:- start:186 stop:1286 length:1101 start_codon:yes stop_codon:yes gene_type:complete
LREQQYNEFLEQFADAFEKYDKWVDPKSLLKFDQEARVKGDYQNNVKKYSGQFMNGTEQRIPISVVPLGDGYIVKDGVTRGKAKQIAKREDPEQLILVNTFCHEVLHFTKDDWDDFQDQANDHPGAMPSTEQDLKNAVQKRFQTGRLDTIICNQNNNVKLDYNNKSEINQYCELGGRWFIETLFPNSGYTWKWFSNQIKACISEFGKLVSPVKTYGDTEIKKVYTDQGGTKYSSNSKSMNEISGNEKLFTIRDNSRISPNLYGAFMKHLQSNPSVDYTVMISYTNVLDKEDADIIEARDAAVESIKELLDMLKPEFLEKLTFSVKHMSQLSTDNSGVTTMYTLKGKHSSASPTPVQQQLSLQVVNT